MAAGKTISGPQARTLAALSLKHGPKVAPGSEARTERLRALRRKARNGWVLTEIGPTLGKEIGRTGATIENTELCDVGIRLSDPRGGTQIFLFQDMTELELADVEAAIVEGPKPTHYWREIFPAAETIDEAKRELLNYAKQKLFPGSKPYGQD